MKPHPRIRKTIKWTSAAATLVLLVMWIGSGWAYVSWANAQGYDVRVGRGCLTLSYMGGPATETKITRDGRSIAAIRSPNGAFTAIWEVGHGQGLGASPIRWKPEMSAHSATLPLYVPTAIAILATAFSWRLDILARHRAKLNLCPTCNYDRTGLAPDTTCPECGTKPTLPHTAP